jgi:hypothetical protein
MKISPVSFLNYLLTNNKGGKSGNTGPGEYEVSYSESTT